MYDFAHPLSDAIEGITHSICTLEFEEHRPFYDWLLEALGFDVNTRPRQIEFARLNLSGAITSKRKLRPDCAAAGIRPPRSVRSARRSALPRATAQWTAPCSSTPFATS